MWKWIRARGKAFGATAIAVVVVAQAALSGDGRVSGEEAFQIVSAFATAAGVYLVPEVPQWPWMKTALAALLAAATAAQSYLLGGFSSADVAAIVLAVLNVLVVQVLPAESGLRTLARPHPRTDAGY